MNTIAQRAHLRELVEAKFRLDAALDDYIAELHDAGWSFAELSTELGVTRQAVHQWYRQRTAESNVGS